FQAEDGIRDRNVTGVQTLLFRSKIEQLVKQAELDCAAQYQQANQIVELNQKRVLESFKNNRISDSHFNSTSGYGYDDLGREGLEAVYADVFGGEDALVRPQIVSGTHAISTA